MSSRWRYDWATRAWHRLGDDGRRSGLAWWQYPHAPGRGHYVGFTAMHTEKPDLDRLRDATRKMWEAPIDEPRGWFGEDVKPSEYGRCDAQPHVEAKVQTWWVDAPISRDPSPHWRNHATTPENTMEYIDTSSTAGKIAVMQAYAAGKEIQFRYAHIGSSGEWLTTGGEPCWDWESKDYRIAPPPATKTALQGAREYLRRTPPKVEADERLQELCNEIDDSVLITFQIDEPRPGTRNISPQINPFDFPRLAAGRYRLLRDE